MTFYILFFLLLFVANIVQEPFGSLIQLLVAISLIFIAREEHKDGYQKSSIFILLIVVIAFFYYGYSLIEYVFFK